MKRFVSAMFLCAVTLCAFAQENFKSLDMCEFSIKGRYLTYTIGEGVSSITAPRYLTPYAINKYETTYELWYEVCVWAEKRGYNFENLGQEGSDGMVGREPTSAGKNHPVTRINWYDSIVWCNALSEKEGLKPCYSYKGKVIRDSGDTVACDLAECDWKANGYRLPSEAEWEYAARCTENGLQTAAACSGEYGKKTADEVAWTYENSEGTHVVGTAGADSPLEGEPIFPGTGKSNGAGIFDMSGNVMEYCWDWFKEYSVVRTGQRAVGPAIGETRVARGAAWSEETFFTYLGDRYAYDPNESYTYLGFRVARSLK